MIYTVIYVIFILLFTYTALSVLYLFILSFAGRFFYKSKPYQSGEQLPFKRIAVFVPAYREDGIIMSTGTNLLSLDYPKDNYDIYIIADSFQPDTIQQLKQLPLNVLEVKFENSTKTKSLNEAFSRITKTYDIALICDADNMLAADFLKRINYAFCKGNQAVQGRRVAKNLDTSYAILDACSEGCNNHMFRRGNNALGLSSAIIGSGMAYDYALLQEQLSTIKAVGGFDKILQLNVVQKGIKIEYLDEAIVFDEKVDSPQAFKQQRRRWVSSQFIYLKRFFFPAFKELFKGNISYFNLAVANNLVLPRAFLFLLLPLLVLIGFLVSIYSGVAAIFLLLLYVITLAIAVPTELVNKNLFKAVLKLPGAVFIMLGTVLHVKKANKTFIHTVHTKTEVSNNVFDVKK